MSSRAARRYLSLLEEQQRLKQLEEEEAEEEEEEEEEVTEQSEENLEQPLQTPETEEACEDTFTQEEKQEEEEEEEEEREGSFGKAQRSNRRKRRKRRGKNKKTEQESSDNSSQILTTTDLDDPTTREEEEEEEKGESIEQPNSSRSGKSKKTFMAHQTHNEKPSNTKAKIAKKKKNRKSGVASPNVDNDIDRLVASIEATEVRDESHKEDKSDNRYQATLAVESIDPKRLDELVELKRIFGPGVIMGADREATNHNRKTSRKKASRRAASTSSTSSLPHSRSLFVKPSRNWPPTSQTGLGMETVKSSAQEVWYKIIWAKEYRDNQSRYQRIQSTHDINAIAQLVMFAPYHIDSLLQLAEVLKQTGEYQEAESLIARCLHAYQSSWHHSFPTNLLVSKARISFVDHEENRGFFFTLFRHIQMLGRKGCYGTATEYCKVLYSLDHSDPLQVAFLIDYYALSSKQYRIVVEFSALYYQRLEAIFKESPAILLNLSYSTALALFLIAEEESSSTIKGQEINPREESIQKLEEALMLFPMVFPELVKKCGSSSTFRDSDGAQLNQHPFFTSCTSSPGLDTLAKLFVERHYALWQPSNIQSWLKIGASRVVARAKVNDPASSTFKTVREQHYPVNSRVPFFKHLHFSEYSDVVPTLPQNMAQELMNNDNPPILEQLPADPRVFEQPLPPNLQNQNPLWLFLRTLLPVPLPDQQPEQPQQGLYDQLLHFLGRDNQNDFPDSDSDDDY